MPKIRWHMEFFVTACLLNVHIEFVFDTILSNKSSKFYRNFLRTHFCICSLNSINISVTFCQVVNFMKLYFIFSDLSALSDDLPSASKKNRY